MPTFRKHPQEEDKPDTQAEGKGKTMPKKQAKATQVVSPVEQIRQQVADEQAVLEVHRQEKEDLLSEIASRQQRMEAINAEDALHQEVIDRLNAVEESLLKLNPGKAAPSKPPVAKDKPKEDARKQPSIRPIAFAVLTYNFGNPNPLPDSLEELLERAFPKGWQGQKFSNSSRTLEDDLRNGEDSILRRDLRIAIRMLSSDENFEGREGVRANNLRARIKAAGHYAELHKLEQLLEVPKEVTSP